MTDRPTIQPITADDAETQSADLIAANLEKLKTLFPEAVTLAIYGYHISEKTTVALSSLHRGNSRIV